MTKKEADNLLIERFKHEMAQAQKSENADEALKHTECAHRFYITLVNSEAFDRDTALNPEDGEIFGN